MTEKLKRRDFLTDAGILLLGSTVSTQALARPEMYATLFEARHSDSEIRDYLSKMKNFNAAHPEDFILDSKKFKILVSCTRRLRRLQRTVGHGNFSLLSFDEAIKISRRYSKVGKFKKGELDLMEEIFYRDGRSYGFLGEKPVDSITTAVSRKDTKKIPGSGNYLYQGKALALYRKIEQAVGPEVILTSGVRSVMKQFLLFLNKAVGSNGNLSLASRSLAPPGYSFHAVGDFDVGQRGLGADNFTSRFADSEVYKKLQDLGYTSLRYDEGNMLGVRYEPWHIKTA